MRTTININNILLKKLKDSSDILQITTNDLITILLSKVLSKNIFKIKTFKSVKYQDKDLKQNWCKLHVRFKPQIYEKGLDLRKCFKLSVSFIISFAIAHLLDEIIEELKANNKNNLNMDNYPLNYIFIVKDFDGIHGFITIWGIPEEKHLKNLIM